MMDLSNPGLLISGLIISTIGMGLFVYGKRSEDLKCLGLGLVMMVFPVFVHSLLLMWLAAAGCLGAAYALPKAG